MKETGILSVTGNDFEAHFEAKYRSCVREIRVPVMTKDALAGVLIKIRTVVFYVLELIQQNKSM